VYLPGADAMNVDLPGTTRSPEFTNLVGSLSLLDFVGARAFALRTS
jgi:hypothetical protein